MAEHGEPQLGECWLQNDDADPNDMQLNPVPGTVVATGTINFNMANVIPEHTQQVRELTQRIGELVRILFDVDISK